SVVIRVDDVHLVVGVYRYAGGAVELAMQPAAMRSIAAPFRHELAIQRELLQPVPRLLGDIYPIGCQCDARRPEYLAVHRTACPTELDRAWSAEVVHEVTVEAPACDAGFDARDDVNRLNCVIHRDVHRASQPRPAGTLSANQLVKLERSED